MLLHRLVQYADDPDTKLPPAYYRPKKVQWALMLEEDGAGARLFDRRPAKGSNDKPLQTDAPYAYRSGKTPPPCLLVDTAQYVLGVPKAAADGTVSQAALTEALRRRKEYAALLLAWAAGVPGDRDAQTAATFVTSGGLARVQVPHDLTHADTIALMTSSGRWLHHTPSAQQAWAATVRARKAGSGIPGICLICGKDGDLLATIPESIKSGAIPTSGLGKDSQLT